MLSLNKSAVMFPMGEGRIKLFVPETRRNLITTRAFLDLADMLLPGCSASDTEAAYEAAGSALGFFDATEFTLWDHAHRNPSMLADEMPEELEIWPFSEFFLVAMEMGLILDDDQEAGSDIFSRRGFADRFRGTFYEQVGTEALMNRTTPPTWWVAQKFSAEQVELRDIPYKYIEERFLTRYFAENFAGRNVLEVGSGTGFYTEKMSEHAKTVVGVDYNADYVEIARSKFDNGAKGNLSFHVADIIDLNAAGAALQGRTFDDVILIDTFLFLFSRAYQPALYENRQAIVANLKKLLAPGGRLLIMDPHPFWLTPWIPGAKHPVGFLTEYRNRKFKVIPTLEEMTALLHGQGLRIVRILEPGIDPEYRNVRKDDWAFFDEFPQWWFWEVEAS